jgi:accessory colonization factor AcfC
MSAPSAISCQSIDIDTFEDSPEAVAIFYKVSEALRTGKRIIVVTGAGISVSSGIPVFLLS